MITPSSEQPYAVSLGVWSSWSGRDQQETLATRGQLPEEEQKEETKKTKKRRKKNETQKGRGKKRRTTCRTG